MSAGYDIGASASTAISSQSGAAQSGTGDFNPTFGSHGGGLGSLLPTVPGSQAWIVYLVFGIVAVFGLWVFLKRGK